MAGGLLKAVIRTAFLLIFFAAGCFFARTRADEVRFDYSKAGPYHVSVNELTFYDATRARTIPVRIYMPDGLATPAPVVVFSHGLGNSRAGYEYLGRQWASHGFASVHPEHVGAAHDIEQKGLLALYRAGKDASYWAMYPKDISFVLDALQQSKIGSQLDLAHVAVAGHSLGAYAVLALAGLRVGDASDRDPRVVAGIPISMSEEFPPAAYGNIEIPLLHITGTHDSSLVYGTLPRDRRVPFESINAPEQTLVTISGANHSTYSDDESPRNRRAHDIIRAATTAFLDATLRHDAAAAAWIRNGGMASFSGSDARIERKDLRIGRIRIETDSLFNDDELRGGSVYRALNHLHTPTHDELVRRVLLIREGDVFDPTLLPECEKGLRRLDFIKSASVKASEPHDGVVDITVRTQDEWTTDPNVDLGRAGGASTWSINLTQKDLFGTGAEVSLTDARTAERTVRMVEVLDPVFIRPYWNLETAFARNSDGGERKVLLEEPFYSTSAPQSFSILLDDKSLDERLYADGIAVTKFHARKEVAQALFGRALGSFRVFGGVEGSMSKFSALAPNGFAPADRRNSFLVVGYGYAATAPVKLDYIDHDAKFDDYSTGVDAALFAGFGREEQEVRASITDGFAFGTHGLLESKLGLSSRFREGAENEIATGEVRFMWRFETSHPSSFVTRLRVDNGRELDGDQQFFADAQRGLRGYPNFAFSGTRAFVFNAEERIFLGRELMQFAAPGIAFFVDSGDAVSRGAMHPHTDAGVGLRFSLNRADSTVLRIDLARTAAKRWALSIGTSQAF